MQNDTPNWPEPTVTVCYKQSLGLLWVFMVKLLSQFISLWHCSVWFHGFFLLALGHCPFGPILTWSRNAFELYEIEGNSPAPFTSAALRGDFRLCLHGAGLSNPKTLTVYEPDGPPPIS